MTESSASHLRPVPAEGETAAPDYDGPAGLLDALVSPPHSALVLGAGGAGRAAAWALREAGVEVAVWNRTPERAAALARELGVRHAERPEPAPLIVNATSVGLDPVGEADVLAALRIDAIAPPELLVDLVYGDEPTALCRWAARGGARVVDGLEVLVRQGARSLARWTGREAPLEAMREGARSIASKQR